MISHTVWLASAVLLTTTLAAEVDAAADRPPSDLSSEDAYLRQQPGRWTLGTDAVQRVIALDNGQLAMRSFKNKRSGREMVPPEKPSEEVSTGIVGVEGAGPWKLEGAKSSRLNQGELQAWPRTRGSAK